MLLPLLLAGMAASPARAVSLNIRVAACPDAGGKATPARPPAWVDAHVRAVQELFAPLGISVTATTDLFTPPLCEVLTREDRDRFAEASVEKGGVTVLVVPRVRDLDVLTYNLQGVHWRARGRRWIFLTARAHPPTLAHELCHYFGLPHDPAGGNLMTPGPSSPAWRAARPPRPFEPRLTDQQARQLRAGIARAAGQASSPAM